MSPLQASEIRGTWCPLFLQIKDHSAIDFGFIEEEISMMSVAGVNGVYAGTSSSEFFNMTFNEYCRLTERFASSCHSHGLPYQLGACHSHPYESLERVAVAADHQPAAIQIILPDWIPTDRRGTLRFVKGCAKNARGNGLVLFNPPNAKVQITPEDMLWLAEEVPELVGISTRGGDEAWYEQMQPIIERLSVFVPGQHLATGLRNGVHGSYSAIAGMNPCAAQSWYELMKQDMEAGLELEGRIQRFISECIEPLMTEHGYSQHACNKFMAVAAGWCGELHQRLRWPYSWIDNEHLSRVRQRGTELIPEFFQRFL